MRVLAFVLCLHGCTANECSSKLCTEEGLQALLDDASSDDPGIQLIQAKAKKVEAKTTPGSEVPFIDQNSFKPSVEDWTKVQNGLLLLRGHAEGSTGHKTATRTEELHSMLATLKDLYANGNQSAKELDAKEEESKEWIADQKVKHEQKLAEIDERDKKHVLEHDFYVNGIHSENMMFDYWGGVRDRQHKKYLSLAKVRQSMLERVKGMIDVYEAVLAGNVPDSSAEEAAQLPEYFRPEAIIDFCDEALSHVRKAIDEL